MKPNLENIEPRQLFAMYIAIVVRNAMEDFHVKYLSDKQMAELNPIIRDAIYTALQADADADDNEQALKYVDGNLQMIPAYWEPPTLLKGYLYFISEKFQLDLARLLSEMPDKN